MTPMSTFIKDPQNTCFEGEDQDEPVLYVLRQSILTTTGWIFLTIIMFLIPIVMMLFASTFLKIVADFFGAGFFFIIILSWYLATFGMVLFHVINWFFNVYIITHKRIIDFDFYGLTYKNISDAPIANIQDVTAKIVGPLNMIFNIGDVLIQTAAETDEFDFEDIDDPGHVRDIISDMITNLKAHV